MSDWTLADAVRREVEALPWGEVVGIDIDGSEGGMFVDADELEAVVERAAVLDILGGDDADGPIESPAVVALRPLAGVSPMTDRNRVSYLIQSDFDRLEDWCRMVRVIFGVSPYLVGSALERADYRDVDVRMVLPAERFEAYSRGRLDSIRFLNRALSVWGQRETGLPIDFQVQSATEAAADFPSPTCPMGVRDWSAIPTSGVPKVPA